MDGPHDVGGKAGHGSIDTEAPPFREPWEARQWALSKNVAVRGGTIDWWRHGIERMSATSYLTLPYFAKWNANDIAQAIDLGVFTLEEVVSGHAKDPAEPARPKTMEELEQQLRDNAYDFSRPADTEPKFALGDTVRTVRTPASGHTRLPAYARAATGVIIAHHGAHLFPDDGARGIERAEHLYTVEFAADELWGDAAPATDSVCIDLWESYLELP